MADSDTYPLDRRDVAQALLEGRDGLVVVAGLGACAWDITAVGDHDLNFPLWGAMGGAASIGLGIALAQPDRRVLVLTGDGEMLMGLGSLATIALQKPENLAVVVLDNERYGETGMQQTHTAFGVDLPAAAAAVGILVTGTVRDQGELDTALPVIRETPGPVFYSIKVKAEELAFVLPSNDGVVLKERMRKAMLGGTG
ncbi:MAG TPA: aldehyde dehydrogenase [Rhodospirillales bacterium]|jgi:thiamine pyrophosphate-dependent acetolactate synthase large subunit-like protein|nr:MAG: Acetolactate synthase isozyme 1 large subunit [Alphaproteobacteria bacterium MarineAlpha3_Bin2]HIC27940.1 aldehyde dehydrogenase [Rhodospirillales bacterium]HIM76919.1 aldehyde dehydrogenase [Rhodospirillales bacterium]